MPASAVPDESSFASLQPLMALGVIGLIVILRLKAESMDVKRISDYFRERGGKLVGYNREVERNWLGKATSIFYWIRYEDGDGNLHVAFCRTSMWSGVYLKEDKIIRYAKPPLRWETVLADLQAENQRLKDEVERLRLLQPGWMPPETSIQPGAPISWDRPGPEPH